MNFSLSKKRYTDDGHVIREGLIFEAGNYPDKNFSLSPEELLAASTDFKPAVVNLEHIKTIFDGKLGYLNAVKPSEDGFSLYGETKLPKWIDDALGDEPIKVSCEWDRENKTIAGLALTTRPRIKDAVLMSAFSEALIKEGKEATVAFSESMEAFEINKDKTWVGADVLQRIHNICAEHGAICVATDAEFISKKEADTIQKMHDISVKSGAKCYFMPANYSTEKKEMTLVEQLKAKFNSWVEEVEKADDPVVDKSTKELEAKFAQLEDKIKAEKEANDAKFSELTETYKAEKEALETKNKELTTELASKTAEVENFSTNASEKELESRQQLAQAKAEQLVKDGKVVPAKQEQLTAIFGFLVGDNKVKFNDTEVDAVEALFNLFDGTVSLKEEIPNDATALNADKTENFSDEIEKAKEAARAWAKKNINRG